MTDESPADPIPTPRTRAIVLMGYALIALGATRAWQDAWVLVRYVPAHLWRMYYTPSLIPWNEFLGVIWGGWPVLLGLAAIRTRSPRLLRASAITAAALGLERSLALVAGGMFDSGWSELYRGTWDPALGPVLPRGMALAGLIASALGGIGLGVVAWRESRRGTIVPAPEATARPARRRRPLVDLAAGTFGVAVLTGLLWTTYITTLERLPWVRNWILSGDRQRGRPAFAAMSTPEMRRYVEAERLFQEGQGHLSRSEWAEGRRALVKATNRFEALTEDFPKSRRFRREFAFAANNFAWFLVTCPDTSAREPESAVILARKALAMTPEDGNTLNTLAVAQFRAGDLDGAVLSFEKSMALRDGGDSFDWYFLAQVESVRGRKAEALALYDKAVAWADANRPHDPELFRFRTEAADRLGLPRPTPPTAGPPTHPARERIFPGPAELVKRR